MEDNKDISPADPEVNTDFDLIVSNLRKRQYKCLGNGSGRRVYDLGNGYVVKVAKNMRGIAQNIVEHDIALSGDTPLFAKILKTSEKFRFLIMEKADRVRHISDVWKYFNVKSNRELYNIKELQDISDKYDLVLRDFGSPINWGQINGKPIIIDYGFTRKVRQRYY
jgi:hypothetical protein